MAAGGTKTDSPPDGDTSAGCANGDVNGVGSSILMEECSICSQGIGEDNPGESTAEVMIPPTSEMGSSEGLGVCPCSTTGV